MKCYLSTSHFKTSATSGKFGERKFSMEINLGYPRALIISVKSAEQIRLNICEKKQIKMKKNWIFNFKNWISFYSGHYKVFFL